MNKPTLIPNVHGVHWDVSSLEFTTGYSDDLAQHIHPVCPDDQTPLAYNRMSMATAASCPECNKQHDFRPNTIFRIQQEIARKFIKLKNQKADFLDLDGQLIPVVKPKRIKVDERYTIEVSLKESRRGGHQVVVYVFDKEQNDKVQILGDLDYQMLRFDHTNLDPRSVLSKIEMTFKDGSKSTIEREEA